MQIKIVIIGFLIGSSYLLGESVHKMFISRHKQINEMIRLLEIIRMDLSFGMYTLGEIFGRLSEKCMNCYSEFFEEISGGLMSDEGKTLDEVVGENIDLLKQDTYLSQNELDEISNLITVLGRSDVDSQQRMIDLTVENLKKITYESKEDISKKGVLYKKLITFVGIGICIIFF
ncbi:MAG: stage III sporulation protein AB [Clostridioides sp.]|nr:stage III sporulation protein AB [Clostridioides sp.]